MATNPTPETPALAGGKDNAPLLAALKALEAQLTTTKEPEKSPTIYTESCPTGTVACDPKEAAAFGLACPTPEIANKKWIIATLDGNLCSIPKDMEKMFSAIPGYSKGSKGVDAAINALSNIIVTKMANEDPALLQRLLADVKFAKDGGVGVFRTTQEAKAARIAGASFSGLNPAWWAASLGGDKFKGFDRQNQTTANNTLIDTILRGPSFRYRAGETPQQLQERKEKAESTLAIADMALYNIYEGIGAENLLQAALDWVKNNQNGGVELTTTEKDNVEKALISLRNALVSVIKGDAAVRALPAKFVSAANRLTGGTEAAETVPAAAPAAPLAGGESGRSSGRRSTGRKSPRGTRSRSPRRMRTETVTTEEEKRRPPSDLVVRVSPRHSEVQELLKKEGYEIATYRTAECPASYDGRKFVKAKGAYPECEKLMGFRWVSPNGRCYPEGLCNIPPEDLVHDESYMTDKMMLLKMLTKVNNQLNEVERDKFIARRSKEMADAYNKSDAVTKNGATRKSASDYVEDAKKALPYNLRELPENAAVVDAGLLLGVPKDVSIRFDDEVRYVKQSFLVAEKKFNSEAERTENAEKFVKASMVCAKASLGSSYEKRKAAGKTKASDIMNDAEMYPANYGTVDSVCAWVDLGEDALWMPREAAQRGKDSDPKIRKAFEAGDDPLGIAYKYVADKYVASQSKKTRAQASAYSPKRA
jgi:hypothetical protein